MTYASGGLISATDYNALVSTNSANIGWVWGTGQGAVGYGQNTSILNTVSSTSVVNASQWAGLFYALNQCLAHQGGTQVAAANLNAQSGGTITYFANITANVTTINTNAANYYAQGATTTGTNYDETVTTTTGLSAAVYGLRTVTFASANQARLFFNAGGQINYFVSWPTGAGSGAQNVFSTLIASTAGWGQKNTTSTGRTGTGYTLGTNSTTFGYRNNVLNTWTTVVSTTSTTAAYTSDTATIQVQTTSSDTTNGANGLNIQFRSVYTMADHTWDDSISGTHRSRIDIIRPEVTYLTNIWGTITVT